jgi:hypothetical protein
MSYMYSLSINRVITYTYYCVLFNVFSNRLAWKSLLELTRSLTNYLALQAGTQVLNFNFQDDTKTVNFDLIFSLYQQLKIAAAVFICGFTTYSEYLHVRL